MKSSITKEQWGDFPSETVVQDPPANAGDTGSILGLGTKIPHATGQLSPCATTTEPVCPTACALQKEKPPPQEACVLHQTPTTPKNT